MKRIPVAAPLGLFALLSFGCASAPPPPPPAAPAPAPKNAMQAELVGAPKWVTMGCGAHFGEKKNAVCGVGGVAGRHQPEPALGGGARLLLQHPIANLAAHQRCDETDRGQCQPGARQPGAAQRSVRLADLTQSNQRHADRQYHNAAAEPTRPRSLM